MKRNLAVMIVALGIVFGCVSGSQAQETAPEIKQWDFIYDGNAFPDGLTLGDNITAEVKDGVLHLTDKSVNSGVGPLYLWKATLENEATVEARVKVVFCKGGTAVYLGVSNDRSEDYLTLYEDRIELDFAKLSYPMDTTAEFHTYRVTIRANDIKVYVDEKLRIDGSGKFTKTTPYGRSSMAFGSGTGPGTGEAYWDWVKYYVAGKVTTEKGTVKVEKTQILFESEDDVMFPCATRFRDGTIWIKPAMGVHMQTERGAPSLSSADNGKTWKFGGAPDSLFGVGTFLEDPDGRIMRVVWGPLRGTALPITVERYDNHQDWLDNHLSAKGGYTEIIKTEVELPWTGSSGLGQNLIRTADGKLIVVGTGCVTGEPRERSFCITSNDEGKTWKFLSTIAYNPKMGSEGYCEPFIEQLANGDLLCLMRTGGSTVFPTIPPAPLMQTRSIDGGKTWEVPHEVAPYGVAPKLKLLSSGILVALFGRPRGSLMVDFDGTGKEWDTLIPFYKGGGCFNMGMLELEPNLIMVLYTEGNFLGMGGVGPLNRLVAAYIRIEKK